MDFDIYLLKLVVLSVCLVTVLRLAWRLLNWAWLRPKTLERRLRQQGLKGNSYRLLYGDMKDMSSMNEEAKSKPCSGWSALDVSHRVLPFLHHIIDTYGKNSFTWSGPVPQVNIFEPELIREILTKPDLYLKPNVTPVFALLLPGLINLEGEKWTIHRRLLNPAFHVEKLKLMMPAFYSSCLELITEWEGIVTKTGSVELDVEPRLATLSADAISRAAFGSSYEEGTRLFELLKELTSLTLQLARSVYIPGSRYLPTATNRRMKEVDWEIQSLLKGIINKRTAAMEAGEAPKEDLLGIMLGSISDEARTRGNTKDHYKMTIKEVIDECKLFYLAGQETTAVLLVWTLIMLSKHEDWQARAREEVMNMFGKTNPDYDGLNKLKIVTMILHEVLRLLPPLTVMTRLVHNELKLGNFLLPAGVLVSMPLMLVHQDPQIWGEDANDFNPERFSEGISKATKGKTAYFPFAWGPRVCIGQNFALVETKVALTMILQRFSLELSPAYTHAPSAVFTLKPQHGAHIILHQL
ncbi:Cytochrome P450 CYP72A219-like protein [Drosera capensis]